MVKVVKPLATMRFKVLGQEGWFLAKLTLLRILENFKKIVNELWETQNLELIYLSPYWVSKIDRASLDVQGTVAKAQINEIKFE